jgi:hypothetical protein
VAAAPEFAYPRPTPSQLDDLVHSYEQMTGDVVLRQPKRNLVATCYRVHGEDFLRFVGEAFERTGTATNLLGELRTLPPRQAKETGKAAAKAESPGPAPDLSEADSAWCGCREEALRPGLLYCASHRPEYLSAPQRRYDRRPSNPGATLFFLAAPGPSVTGTPRP